VPGIQRDQVGLLPDRQPAHRATRGLRAPAHGGEQHGRGHVRVCLRGHHVAPAGGQALPVFEQHQLLGRVDADVAVGADAPGSARRLPGGSVEDAVAEVGFGARAQAGHRAAGGGAPVFPGVHVRGMHQAPPRIHRRVVQQPGHGTLARMGEAVLDLLHLFGDVNVHRCGGILRHQAGQHFAQCIGRHGAQGMRRQASRAPCAAHTGAGAPAGAACRRWSG
jgi:hypothetical protein